MMQTECRDLKAILSLPLRTCRVINTNRDMHSM